MSRSERHHEGIDRKPGACRVYSVESIMGRKLKFRTMITEIRAYKMELLGQA